MQHPTSADPAPPAPPAPVAPKPAAYGFARLPNHLIDSGVFRNLRQGALRVLLNLLRLADEQGRCWPSQGRLASSTGLSIRSVQYALLELADAGLIVREQRGRPGRCSVYRVTPMGPMTGHAVHDARRRKAARSRVRPLPQSAAGRSRTPLHTTQTQDSDIALTHSRVADATTRRDVCAAECAQEQTPARQDAHDAPRPDGRVARLLALGIDEEIALELLATHVPSQIDCALDNAAFLAAHDRLGHAAGYVIDALRCNYGPLPERLDAQKREARHRRQREAGTQQIADAQRKVEAERVEADRAAAEALAFVKALDDAALASATHAVLESLPRNVRDVMAARDPRTSRHLAMLVRDHVRHEVVPAPAGTQRAQGEPQ